MEGFHVAGEGGLIKKWRQVICEVTLEPGKYIVFAKGRATITTKSGYTLGEGWAVNLPATFEAALEFGQFRDSYLGQLVGDSDNPGNRFESFALNLAGEVDQRTKARLVISSDANDRLFVFEPRISAIQVSELRIGSGGWLGGSIWDIRKIAFAALAGAGIGYEMAMKALQEGPEAEEENEVR